MASLSRVRRATFLGLVAIVGMAVGGILWSSGVALSSLLIPQAAGLVFLAPIIGIFVGGWLLMEVM